MYLGIFIKGNYMNLEMQQSTYFIHMPDPYSIFFVLISKYGSI